jgi:PPK2 family polyphosphate:nucleotide phosphotransferase
MQSTTRTRGDARGRLGDELRVAHGARVRLATLDAADTYGRSRDDADDQLRNGLDRLAELQDRLWAEAKHAVLVVLQGMDASGKDGTIKHVMTAFNPQGCTVTSFKVPTPVELAHDYLWRVHQRTPGKGEVGVFNRSHYEDVLVVRVHELVTRAVWSARFDQINAFEASLAAAGTTIVKFFLHIDRDEQRRRFEARLDDPTKRWKFRTGDLLERKLWDAYEAAYEDVLSRCSTKRAPWYVVPANHKWFRNLAVAEIVADTIAGLDPQYPPPAEDLSAVRVE